MFAITLSTHRLQELAKEAYIYAYPLVLMGVTADKMTAIDEEKQDHIRAPYNHFAHLNAFPDTLYTDIIRPSLDTLYSFAWLKLDKEPVIISVPAFNKRYYSLQIIDAWTSIIAAPGTRTTGTDAKKLLLAGPNWHGEIPKGVMRINAPTNLVWVIVRIQTSNEKDFNEVNKLQSQLKIQPLSHYTGNYDNENDVEAGKDKASKKIKNLPPLDQVEKMDAITFFKKFSQLMKKNPPLPEDSGMVIKLKELGIIPGRSFDSSQFTTDEIIVLNEGTKQGFEEIEETSFTSEAPVNGWRMLRFKGHKENYLRRAATAMFLLGLNQAQDAVYATTVLDQHGKPLTGKTEYVLHFSKKALPPVNAFWSITLYTPDGKLYDNKTKRYSLSSKHQLKYNDDGSLDIYIQHEPKADGSRDNWLPAPEGEYRLVLRLYWPTKKALNGAWSPPPVKKDD